MAVTAGTAYVGLQYKPGDVARLQSQTTAASSGYASSWRRAAGLAVGFIGAAALGKALFVDPLRSAGEFERTMNVLQAQTGATGETMGQLSDQAISLGADIKLPGTSASDAAEAMLALSKGGLSVKDTMAATRGVLVASAAAQIDNAQAAEIVANALNAFSLEGREAGRVADLLAGAANAATGDMPDFAAALQQVGTSAHALGVPIEDTVTGLGELAKAGIQGSDAGTSLKTMFQRLIPSTDKAQKAVAKLGIDLFDSHGEFVGLRPAIAQYSAELQRMTPEARNAAIQTIFGSDAQRAANIILGQGVGAFDKMNEAVTKQGQAQKLAAAQNKGFAGAMDGLRSTVETLQLQIGLKMLPVMTQLVRFMSANLPTAVNATMSAFSAIAGVIGTVVGFFRDGSTASQILAAALVGAAAGVAAYRIVMGTATAATVVFTAAQAALTAIMALNPFVIAVVAIAAFVAALVILYKRNEQVRETIQRVWAAVGPLVAQGLEAARRAVQLFAAAVRQHMNTAREIIQAFVTAATAFWRRFGDAITSIGRNAFNTVLGVIRGQMNIIRGVINVVLGIITGDWSRAWQGVRQIVSGGVQVVTSLLRGMANAVGILARAAGAAIVDGVRAGISGLAGVVRSGIAAIPGALGDLGRLLYSAGQQIIDGLVSGIISRISAVASAARSAASAVTSHFPGSPVRTGPLRDHPPGDAGRQIAELIAGGIQRGMPNLSRIADTMAGTISGGVDAAARSAEGLRLNIPAPALGGGAAPSRRMLAALAAAEPGRDRPILLDASVLLDGEVVGRIVDVRVRNQNQRTARALQAGSVW